MGEHMPASSLPFSPRVLKEGGGDVEGWESLEVELTSRLGMMDVSIRDMETRSVTDISIMEISH